MLWKRLGLYDPWMIDPRSAQHLYSTASPDNISYQKLQDHEPIDPHTQLALNIWEELSIQMREDEEQTKAGFTPEVVAASSSSTNKQLREVEAKLDDNFNEEKGAQAEAGGQQNGPAAAAEKKPNWFLDPIRTQIKTFNPLLLILGIKYSPYLLVAILPFSIQDILYVPNRVLTHRIEAHFPQLYS